MNSKPGQQPEPPTGAPIAQPHKHPPRNKPETGTQTRGTDYRHAVEFSKNGHTETRPLRASSLAGCPTLRRCPDVPHSEVRSVGPRGPRRAPKITRLPRALQGVRADACSVGQGAGRRAAGRQDCVELPATALRRPARRRRLGRPRWAPARRPTAGRPLARSRAGGQATPRGRNCTLTRGPTGLAVLGMQCSHVRWHDPPMTTRSP